MTFRTLRRRAGFSQYSLAASTRSVRQETISQIERGAVRRPLSTTLIALSIALGEDVATVHAAICNSHTRARRRRTRGAT